MKSILKRIEAKFQNKKFGLIAIAGMAIMTTAIALAASEYKKVYRPGPIVQPLPIVTPQPVLPQPVQPQPIVSNPNIPNYTFVKDLTVHTRLSQNKVVKDFQQELYLEVSVDTPQIEVAMEERKPTDMILILDRSGSMAADNRLPFAKAAIKSLVNRLHEGDRIALVGFDDRAQVYLPLTRIASRANSHITRIVDSIRTGGSTNMSDGIYRALGMMPKSDTSRTQRVILLSDGQANQGVTDPTQLAGIVKTFAARNAVMSTIGMGIGFNESLMSLLADYGSGNYSYLESLASLDKILTKDLEHARAQFAPKSRLFVELAPGVEVSDAAGYPVERAQYKGKNVAIISTGQLRADSRKSFILTLKAPFQTLGKTKLVNTSFAFTRDGQESRVVAGKGQHFVEVLPQEKRQEALASMDKELYKRSWVKNNFGKMKKRFAYEMRKGNQSGVMNTIKSLKDSFAQAGSYAEMDLLADEEVVKEMEAMKADAQQAFVGTAGEQSRKQNSYAKKAHLGAIQAQRKVEKKN